MFRQISTLDSHYVCRYENKIQMKYSAHESLISLYYIMVMDFKLFLFYTQRNNILLHNGRPLIKPSPLRDATFLHSSQQAKHRHHIYLMHTRIICILFFSLFSSELHFLRHLPPPAVLCRWCLVKFMETHRLPGILSLHT